jgi:formate hydrogenlyase transcriptional activator
LIRPCASGLIVSREKEMQNEHGWREADLSDESLNERRIAMQLNNISHSTGNDRSLCFASGRHDGGAASPHFEERLPAEAGFDGIMGQSPALRRVLQQVEAVAVTDSTVLLLGETGTGKGLLARAIHGRSARRERSFVTLNCAAIPSGLLESELFGHERGAFTGAITQKTGRLELAEKGTLFLDEIGDIPLELQPKLLRVLQEREFERLGSTSTKRADVRLVAATHRNLEQLMEENLFRSDLYYRLNVFPIELPPLREREDDVLMLLHHFVDRYDRRLGKKFGKIDERTVELFCSYDWPGNIRELQNVVERAVILCEGETFSVDETWLERRSSSLPQRPVSRARVLPEVKRQFADRERQLIEAALAESQGRVSGPHGAAVKLGIPRQTVEWKIAHLGIDKLRFRALPSARSSVFDVTDRQTFRSNRTAESLSSPVPIICPPARSTRTHCVSERRDI